MLFTASALRSKTYYEIRMSVISFYRHCAEEIEDAGRKKRHSRPY